MNDIANTLTIEELDYLIRQLKFKKNVCMFSEREVFFQSIIDKLENMKEEKQYEFENIYR